MEKNISKNALKNILTAAGPGVIDMDDDTKKALAALWELHNEEQGDNLILANLSDCEEYVIWKVPMMCASLWKADVIRMSS